MDSEKSIKHYSNRHKILLVGEGNFSFAACLAQAFGNASNMVATSLDTEEELRIKHPSAAENVALLKQKGCTVMHGVDASTMKNNHLLHYTKFDRIVFNFPHAGFISKENNSVQIEYHMKVVSGFLRNAYEMVSVGGEVHITHKTSYPYTCWEIEELGMKAGFFRTQKEDFYIWYYPGYTNKRGGGNRADDTFPVGDCSTFKFSKF